MTNRPIHHEFIFRARRRWVAWRMLESAGIGGVLGAGPGFLVVLVLWWRGEPAVLPAGMLLALGAAAGMLWAWGRRPGILQTALLIDRQMGWNDLLSTAMGAQRWGDPTFTAIVSMQADDRCERISSAELVLRRLGSRHWGGIGLAGSILMTLALLSGQASSSGAFTLETQDLTPSTSTPSSSEKRTHRSMNRSAPNNSQAIIEQRIASNSDDSNRVIGTGRGASEGRLQAGDSAGSTAGRTEGAKVPTLRRSEAPDNLANVAGENAASDLPNPQQAGQNTHLSKPIAPWNTASWPGDVVAATRKLENAQVPDSYQDLVREYFTPGAR